MKIFAIRCFSELFIRRRLLFAIDETKMVKLKIGDKAPDFSLQSGKGEKVTLSQFLGTKNIVIFFYPMDESPVCSREAEAFKDKYEVFKKFNAEVIGVSSQSVESHKMFANHHVCRLSC